MILFESLFNLSVRSNQESPTKKQQFNEGSSMKDIPSPSYVYLMHNYLTYIFIVFIYSKSPKKQLNKTPVSKRGGDRNEKAIGKKEASVGNINDNNSEAEVNASFKAADEQVKDKKGKMKRFI